MNRGLVVGKVIKAGTGGSVANAVVYLGTIVSNEGVQIQKYDEEGKARKWIYGKSRSDGKFSLYFGWDGTGVADALNNSFLSVGAWTEINSKNSSVMTSKGMTSLKGYVSVDIVALIKTPMSTFDSYSEIMDFAIDIGMAAKNLRVNGVRMNKFQSVMTTENKVLCGGGYVYLE